jgi:hypothetical protein
MFLFRSSQNSSDDPHSAATAVVGDLGMRGRSPARPIALLIACGITLIAAIAGGIATLVAELHHRALTDSGREMGNIALVLAAKIASSSACKRSELLRAMILSVGCPARTCI